MWSRRKTEQHCSAVCRFCPTWWSARSACSATSATLVPAVSARASSSRPSLAQSAAARQRLTGLTIDPALVGAPPDGDVDVVIDVVYDGADLADVAQHTGLTVAAVVDAHVATPWRVGFGGFAPGFAYLVGGDPRLAVPRRAEPRTRVPAGSVGLAGEFSGVYPRESPGGWQLIGRTDAVLWDIDRTPPALLRPGMWVRFRAV